MEVNNVQGADLYGGNQSWLILEALWILWPWDPWGLHHFRFDMEACFLLYLCNHWLSFGCSFSQDFCRVLQKLCRNNLWISTKECTIASHGMCCVQKLDYGKPPEKWSPFSFPVPLSQAFTSISIAYWKQTTNPSTAKYSRHMSFCNPFIFLDKPLTPGAREDILLELEK